MTEVFNTEYVQTSETRERAVFVAQELLRQQVPFRYEPDTARYFRFVVPEKYRQALWEASGEAYRRFPAR